MAVLRPSVSDPELMAVTDRFVAPDLSFGHLDEDPPSMHTPFPPMRRAHVASGRLWSNSYEKKALDGTTHYAKNTVFGRVAAGRMVRRACATNVKDLMESAFHRLHFEVEAVQRPRLNRVSCPSRLALSHRGA